MQILKIKIGKKEYRLFEIVVFKGTKHEQTVMVAEERLNRRIEQAIQQERYMDVMNIDDLYGYWVPQDIANEEIETEIIDSIESVMREDLDA